MADQPIDIDQLIANLTRDAKAKAKTSSAKGAQPGSLKELGDLFLKALDDVAEEHGVKRDTIISDIVAQSLAGFLMAHHARKGNTAKTVRWGVAVMSLNANFRARRQREFMKRLSDKAV